MALGPNVLEKTVKDEAIKFESAIDVKLLGQRLYSDNITISAPSGMEYAHFLALKDNYISAGWKHIVWNADRESPTITFYKNARNSNISSQFDDR